MVLSAGKWDHSEVQRAQESCGAQRGGAGGSLPCSGRAPRRVGKQEAAREASEGSMGPDGAGLQLGSALLREVPADGSTSLNMCLLTGTESRLRIKKTWAGQLLARP